MLDEANTYLEKTYHVAYHAKQFWPFPRKHLENPLKKWPERLPMSCR